MILHAAGKVASMAKSNPGHPLDDCPFADAGRTNYGRAANRETHVELHFLKGAILVRHIRE